MKTVLISSFHAHISRNILDTPVLQQLLERDDLSIVLLVPPHKREHFALRYEHSRVRVEGVEPYLSTRSHRGLLFKRLAVLLFETGTTAAKKRYKFFWDRNYLYYWSSLFLGKIGSLRSVRAFVRWGEERYGPRVHAVLFKSVAPDLFFATDIQNENDAALAIEARRRAIPIIGMIRSWDNPTQRILRIIPERLLVGSQRLLEEVVSLSGIPRERVIITGNPHYDRYREMPTVSREQFLRSVGLDPEKPVVFFAPGGDKIMRHNDLDPYVAATLRTAGYQIYLRYPPGEEITLLDCFSGPGIFVDKPGVRFGASRGEFEISAEDDRRLVDAIRASDVVVTGPTSIPLDAAFFDKPAVLADFYPPIYDRESRHERLLFEKTWGCSLDHIRTLLATGGVAYADSREQFLREIESALVHPAERAAGRARIRDLWFSHCDGASARRIFQHLNAYL